MPTVPIYQPGQVQMRPIMQQGITVNASPEAFGAAAGRGLQNLAQGLGQIGDAVTQVQQLEDVTKAKETDTEFSAWVREAKYGENGFMTLSGKDAVDGRAAFEKQMEAKRAELGGKLQTPGARRAYDQASKARVDNTLESSIIHTANERKNWVKGVASARIESFASDALAEYSNPDAVAKNIAAAQAEFRQISDLAGKDPEQAGLEEKALVSGIYKNVALRIAQDDPLKADEFRKQHMTSLTGEDQYALEGALGDAVRTATASNEVSAILGGSRRVADVPGDMISEVMAAGNGDKPAVAADEKPANADASVTVKELAPVKQQVKQTNAKTFLHSISAHKDRPGDTSNLDDSFAENLAAMIQDAPPGIREHLGIMSGYRSNERQKQLFANSDKTGRRVAFPAGYVKSDGTVTKGSNHLHGRAADLSYKGKSLKRANAPKEVLDWVHGNASKYGLRFRMSWEPWHIEPGKAVERSTTVEAADTKVAFRASAPSADDIEAAIAAQPDPRVQDLMRKQINAQIETRNKLEVATKREAVSALWSYIDQGATPDQIPQDIRTAAGLQAENEAWSAIEAKAKHGEVKDDPVTAYQLRLLAASDPEAFAAINLLEEYGSKLSSSTVKELTGNQQTALTDRRKAEQDNSVYIDAHKAAEDVFSKAGIIKGDSIAAQGADNMAMQARLFESMQSEVDQMRQANGKTPSADELRAIAAVLAMKAIATQKSTGWFGGESVDEVWEGKAFQRFDGLADNPGAELKLVAEYKDIPVEWIVAIQQKFVETNKRPPTKAEIEEEWSKIALELIGNN